MFRTTWVHLGPFSCLTKLDAKRTELVHTFMPPSRVRIICNERTRFTPLDLELTFWCVSYYLGAFGMFGCLTKLGAKRAEVVQKFVPRSRVGIFHNERTLSTPLYPKLMFWEFRIICVHSGLFGCLTKLVAKQTELVQKFVPRSRVGIFRNERIRSTPLHHKLTFSCVFFNLDAFVTVW